MSGGSSGSRTISHGSGASRRQRASSASTRWTADRPSADGVDDRRRRWRHRRRGRILTRIEIAELVPGIRVDDVFGGRFGARDGYGDPLVALAGFAAAAQLEGATFREGVAVESLLRDGDHVTGVRTGAGDVRADRVLLATGCWTAALAATAAVPVPIWPYRRSIMQSGPLPQLARIPLTIEWESGFHFRPKGAAQRFAMPNLTPDGKEEKGPAGAPSAYPGEFAPLEVLASLEPWVRARAAWRHPAFVGLRIGDSWLCCY